MPAYSRDLDSAVDVAAEMRETQLRIEHLKSLVTVFEDRMVLLRALMKHVEPAEMPESE